MNFFVTANTAGAGLGIKGMSGGDRIALACINKWSQEGHKVKLFIGKSGLLIYNVKNKNVEFIITSSFLMKDHSYIGLFIFEILATIGGCVRAFKMRHAVAAGDIVYSSSDFWPDSIPAFLLKLIRPKIRWVAGFYLFAPAPWSKETPYKNVKWHIGLLYWLMQLPVYGIVKKYADLVFVTSQPDVEKFISRARGRDGVMAIRGGVDIKPSEAYFRSPAFVQPDLRRYDACFIGRFHYQKGIFELIDVWKQVCRKKEDARLAMIGEGPLEVEAKEKIAREGLDKNIELLGFKDGEEKYEVFKNSRIVIHPATYDSGGMAAAEAMAWGLPGVSFDLEALRTYYPKGMVKVTKGDLNRFALEILNLLSDKNRYLKEANDARKLIVDEWDWDKRTQFIYSRVMDNR